MQEFKPYQPRPIRFVELWTYDHWRIKVYTIIGPELVWDPDYIDIAKQLALHTIQARAEQDHHHYTGFLTIHLASMFNQIIFDWWARENELRHIVFKANADTPKDFQNITASGEAFCVWELQVIAFEREAWIRHVLERASAPDFDAYFSMKLELE